MNTDKISDETTTANAYINIRSAIIKQAIKDYKDAIKHGDKCEAEALERWFTDSWGEMLSGCNGELIIETVRKELK